VTAVDVSPTIVERLAAHRTLSAAPRDQLEWLAARGRLQQFAAGETVVRAGEPITELAILLTGHMSIRVNRGSGTRKVMEWFGGDVGGLLPYSRLTKSPGYSIAEEATEMFRVDREHFPRMIRECHELTAILVHVMLDRARHFTSSDFHDEKMLSLGRLAAGLAHELNNPTSAVVRSAEALASRLPESLSAFRALGAAQLADVELAAFDKAADVCVASIDAQVRSPMEQMDREDAIADWLADRGANTAAAQALGESSVTLESLDALAAALPKEALDPTLAALAEACTTRKLTSEIEKAAFRIHELVAAIKSFTYMDQAAVPKPVDIARGLADTITMLQAKARKKSVGVTLEAPAGLPMIQGFGGELNQVWVNLLDNAIDAVPENGRVQVAAAVEGDVLAVRIVDDGPGIPDADRGRIFEPFFTTKPVGSGTGLGLDIVRRLVGRHDGEIDVSSRPGRTEFCVMLPTKSAR
jgi:signal transduction histidine kinase